MTHYVCKILDRVGRVLRSVPYTADNDRCAVDQAIVLQLVTPEASGFEVWQGGRQVMIFQNARPAWRSAHQTQPRTPLRARMPQPLKA